MPITRTKADGTKTEISVTPVKIVIAGVVVVAAYSFYRLLVGEPRHKVVAFENKRSIVKYAAFNYDLGKWEIKTRPLPIEEHANESKTAMEGLTQSFTMKKYYEFFLKYYTYNDLRLLHNYFLSHIDAEQSIYDWIAAETPSSDEEVNLQNQVKNKLTAAGVGNNLVMKIPTADDLKK